MNLLVVVIIGAWLVAADNPVSKNGRNCEKTILINFVFQKHSLDENTRNLFV